MAGAYIPLNSPVTLDVSGQGGGWAQAITSLGLSSGIPDLKSAISSALIGYGLFPVDVDISADNIIPAVTWAWSGSIVLRPTYDTDSEGLAQAVGEAIQAASGYAATVAVTNIGSPRKLDAPADHSGVPTWLKKFLDTLQQDATWIAVGGVGLIALVVVAAAYGPNIKKLASVSL